MPIEIIVPRLGWSMEEGAFVGWLKKDGELVKAGEPLFSIEGDKAVQEIESIDSGILRIAANGPKPGDSIRVGELLGHLVAATDIATPERVPPSSGGVVFKPSSDAVPTQPERLHVVELPAPESSPSSRAAAISPRAVRAARELGMDWTTVRGTGRTGRIRERDIRAAANVGAARAPSAAGSKPPVSPRLEE